MNLEPPLEQLEAESHEKSQIENKPPNYILPRPKKRNKTKQNKKEEQHTTHKDLH